MTEQYLSAEDIPFGDDRPLPPPLTAEQSALLAAQPANPDVFTIDIASARQLCDEPDSDTGQLLGPLVLAGGRTVIVGDTGEGKTTLAFQIIRSILEEDDFLGYQGAGAGGRALIVDLEQGRRSVKRALRNGGLAGRDDVDLALIPDGLSLDKNYEHLRELERVIAAGGYSLVDLDPYYKAHRAEEPNAERPIVDLMRILDGLRARFGFSLILPAHPRKEAPGAPSVRKLTIHDIAGSGAVTRGAEIVLGIERVAHGLARLRYLKDREGELPIGEAWNLVYAKGEGFTRHPNDTAPARDYQAEILELAADGKWRTIREFKDDAKAGEKALKTALASLTEDGRMVYAEGPPGRSRQSKCWQLATASNRLGHPEAPEAPPSNGGVLPPLPPHVLRGSGGGSSTHTPDRLPPPSENGEAPDTFDDAEPDPSDLDPDAGWPEQ